MKTYPTANIRNVALVERHGGSGKATLVEALLVRAGAIPRAGRVDDGSTVSDTEPEEVKRKISLALAVAPVEWEGHQVQPHRHPGLRRLHERGGSGPRAWLTSRSSSIARWTASRCRPRVIWRRCAALGLPHMVFINKEDKERADFHRVLDQLRTMFGSGFAPLELPIGEKAAFVADVLSDQAFEYEPDGKHHTEPMPADLEEEEHRVHDELIEEIVSSDDEQLERYLSGEVPSVAELEKPLAHEVLEGKEFPSSSARR